MPILIFIGIDITVFGVFFFFLAISKFHKLTVVKMFLNMI